MGHTIKVEVLLDEHDKALLNAVKNYEKHTDDNGDNDTERTFYKMQSYLYRLIASKNGVALITSYGLSVNEKNDRLNFSGDTTYDDVPF